MRPEPHHWRFNIFDVKGEIAADSGFASVSDQLPWKEVNRSFSGLKVASSKRMMFEMTTFLDEQFLCGSSIWLVKTTDDRPTTMSLERVSGLRLSSAAIVQSQMS